METWSPEDFVDVIALKYLSTERAEEHTPRETDCLFDLLGMEEPDDGKE